MPAAHSILVPALALVIWSLVMWLWMYARRLPAIARAGIDPAQAKSRNALDGLPLAVRQVADNYNHLMEQPTIFYALVFLTYLAGAQSFVATFLAWAYVASRVVHSLIQATVNVVVARFAVHVVGTLILMALAVIGGLALLS